MIRDKHSVHLAQKRVRINDVVNTTEYQNSMKKRGTSFLYRRIAFPEMYFAIWNRIEFSLLFNFLASVNSNFSVAFDGLYGLEVSNKLQSQARCGSKRSSSYDNMIYRVIHKSLRDFRTRLRNNQDIHGRKEHINRYRISPSFFLY